MSRQEVDYEKTQQTLVGYPFADCDRCKGKGRTGYMLGGPGMYSGPLYCYECFPDRKVVMKEVGK